MTENVKPSRLGLQNEQGQLSISKNSVLGAIGGWLGIVESILPALVFVTILSLTKNTVAAVLSAVSISAFFLLLQIIRKKPLTQAIAGAIGIGISAFLPLREGGQAADYFVQGFFTNAIYATVLLISVIIRWPVVGLLVGALLGDVKAWRSDKPLARRYQIATFLWIGLFLARLFVQVPLYFAGQTELLGIFRIAMGVPLYALCIWFTWLLIRGSVSKSR